MTNVIELAKQAGLFTHKEVQPEITRFATLVRNAALEEAARICDALDYDLVAEPDTCSAAIRNLKDPTP